MKVFISSIIGGYERYRAAAQEAVQTLGHQVIRAEDFAATARTPQQACLDGVRASDIVLLLIGERYGALQPSGLSATHEEYQEARERKPVLVLVESGVAREPAQQAFLDEVQAWATGHHRAGFSSPEELSRAVVRAIHEHELATSSGPVDEAEIVGRATALLPRETVHTYGEDLEVTQGRERVPVARHDASFVVLEVGECADPSSFNSSVVFAVTTGGLPKR